MMREPLMPSTTSRRRVGVKVCSASAMSESDSRSSTATAVAAFTRDVFGPHLGFVRDTVAHHARAGGAGHVEHTWVVGVQHRQAVGRQLLDQLLLGLLDPLDGAQSLEVHG